MMNESHIYLALIIAAYLLGKRIILAIFKCTLSCITFTDVIILMILYQINAIFSTIKMFFAKMMILYRLK